MKEKIKALFKEYYNDETMPVVELEDKVLDLFDVVGRSYSFVEPKFFVDDKVWFKDNKGFEMEGKIVGVETH